MMRTVDLNDSALHLCSGRTHNQQNTLLKARATAMGRWPLPNTTFVSCQSQA